MDLVGLSVRTGHFCLHLLMSDRVSKLFCMGFYTVGTCDFSSLFFPSFYRSDGPTAAQ